MQFRLMTYNIHKGIGGIDRRYRPERIVETIAQAEVDVVLLQEVDDGVPRSRRHRQVDWLADALDMPYRAYQRNVRLKWGHYGNAIISRFPLSDIHNVELSVRMKKPRRAIAAHLRLHEGEHSRTVKIYNMHLGLAGYERNIQINKLLSDVDLRHSHQTTPVILGGDFNDLWGSLGRKALDAAGFQSAGKQMLTFPAVRPLRALDRLFYRGDLRLPHCYAAHSRVARQASDHRPLVAEFKVLFG